MKRATRVHQKPREEVRFQERERAYVYSVAMKYLKDEEEAADATQDAMLLAFRHRDSFRGDSRFTTWLYRVAATTALMHLRKKRRTGRGVSIDAPAANDEALPAIEVAWTGPSPEDEVAAHEAVAIAEQRLDKMGDKYGSIFHMRFGDGYSEAEIARKLKLNVATVKTRAYRARAALRDELASQLR
jgi:RNA polymerase sigma-70 factor (ECF subfamily)